MCLRPAIWTGTARHAKRLRRQPGPAVTWGVLNDRTGGCGDTGIRTAASRLAPPTTGLRHAVRLSGRSTGGAYRARTPGPCPRPSRLVRDRGEAVRLAAALAREQPSGDTRLYETRGVGQPAMPRAPSDQTRLLGLVHAFSDRCLGCRRISTSHVVARRMSRAFSAAARCRSRAPHTSHPGAGRGGRVGSGRVTGGSSAVCCLIRRPPEAAPIRGLPSRSVYVPSSQLDDGLARSNATRPCRGHPWPRDGHGRGTAR